MLLLLLLAAVLHGALPRNFKKGVRWWGMALLGCFVAILSLLCTGTVFAMAQDVQPVAIPEKIMASKLQTYSIEPLSEPPLGKHCSNALAIVDVVISADGKVRSADFVSGFPELKKPALDAVQRWSYTPYIVDGKPIAVKTQASIFYLGDGEAMPMYVPDGNGGAKGGSTIPLPPDCGPGPQIVKQLLPLGTATPAQTAPKEATAPVPGANGAYLCHAGADMVCPKLIYSVDPLYGPVARKAKLQGTVLVSLVVGTNGLPRDIALARSIRDGLDTTLQKAGAELDQHAIDAVRQYRFEPGSLKGVPIPVAINAEVNFQLY